MRKIFATLKSVVAAALVVSMTLAVSCSYDDTAVKNDIKNLKGDLAKLTERVVALENAAKAQAPTLEELLDGKAVIVEVTTNENGDQIIKLSNGKEITVLAPAACECDEPLQYRVVDGVLEVSADGNNWVAINGVAANQVVADVVINEDGSATIKLANGEEFTVGVAELIECEAARTAVYVLPDATKAVNFTINDAVEDINVMNQPNGWKASIEAATRAAGGSDYVLNITGPAKGNVYADKEGVVSVHFNTAAGACKVMNVAVNLAELTLAVENGVVTLTNSVAFEQTNRWGETYTDFADFSIGVMEASAYEQYGNSVFADTYDDMYCEYSANVNFTQRTTGFQNIVDLQFYEDGTCEKESYTFSLEQLANMFYPIYNFELGGDYIIFVTLDTELVNHVACPVLANALMVDYKNTVMSANYVSSTWNGANYEFNLAGYTHYILGWVEKQQVDMYIGYGVCSSLAEFLSLFAGDMGGVVGLPGTMVAGPLAGTYNLADLRAMSMTGYAPEISANTEYYFYIYPVNIESEMDLYAAVDAANVFEFGTFETTGYTAGAFETGFDCVVNEISASYINVSGTFNENVVSYYSEWFDYKPIDVEERIAYMLESPNFISTEYGPLESGHYPQAYPTYLCIIALNANGEYVYLEQKFEYELPQFELVSAVATYQENNSNWYALTFTDAEGNVITTAAGNGGVNYLNAGTWDFSNWYSSGFALDNSYYNDTFIGAISMEVKHVDGQYSIVITIPQGIFTYTGAIEGLIVPEPVVLPNCENLTFQLCQADGFISASFSGYGDIRLVDSEGKNYINIEVNDQTLYTHSYVFDSTYEGYDAGTIYPSCTYVRYDGPGYDGDGLTPSVSSGTMKVVANGNDSTITIDFVLEDGNKFSGVYTGALPF